MVKKAVKDLEGLVEKAKILEVGGVYDFAGTGGGE
jgi:hypothetical protein